MYGHVNPLLHLAMAARRAGHVVVASGPDLVPHVESHGVPAWAVGARHRAVPSDVDWLTYFEASAHQRVADLVPAALRWRPDLVIAEETELAGPVAAAVTGARLVVHGLGIMPPPLVWDAYAAALQELSSTWRTSLSADALRATTYLEVCPPALRPNSQRPWPRAVSLRPALPQPPGEHHLPKSIDNLPYADTVHLTLGTVYQGNLTVLRTALDGLRDLTVNVVVAAGPGVAPATLGSPAAHVLTEPYLSYPLLLSRCQLVVSQGGFGVLLAGLGHGLPQLVIPQGADQYGNAEAVRRAGAGLVLTPASVTAAAVAEAVTRLRDEPSFAAAARAVQAASDAMPDADTVLTGLVEA